MCDVNNSNNGLSEHMQMYTTHLSRNGNQENDGNSETLEPTAKLTAQP